MRKYSGLLLIGLSALSLAACSSNEETIEVTKPDMGDTRIDLTSGELMANDGTSYYGGGSTSPELSSMSSSSVEIYSLDGASSGRITGPQSVHTSGPSFGGIGNKSVEITNIGQPSTPRQNTGYSRSAPSGYDSGYDSYEAKKNSRVRPAAFDPVNSELLSTVYFAHSSAALSLSDMQSIEVTAREFNSGPDGMLSVEGHSSTRAMTENPITRKRINLDISAERASAVAKALISFGVPGNRIKVVAWGEEHDAGVTSGRSDESASRRVEILRSSGQ